MKSKAPGGRMDYLTAVLTRGSNLLCINIIKFKISVKLKTPPR